MKMKFADTDNDRDGGTKIVVLTLASLAIAVAGYFLFFSNTPNASGGNNTCTIYPNRDSAKFEIHSRDANGRFAIEGFYPTKDEAYESAHKICQGKTVIK